MTLGRAVHLVAPLFILATPATVRAAILTVAQDGSGDYETIWEALTAVQDADRIEIRPGYYDESTDDGEVRAVDTYGKRFSVEGMGSGPDDVIVAFLRIEICGDVTVERLTFRDSCSPLRITDFCDHQPYAVVVTDCTFLENGYGDCAHEGAAIRALESYDTPSTLLVEGCVFEGNVTSTGEGGAVHSTAELTVRDTHFIGNTSGGLFAIQLVAENCLFWKNESPFEGSAIIAYERHDIRNCTFWGNRGPSTIYSIVGPSQHSEITNCIVGGTVGGYGIDCAGWFVINCCVLSFNERGNAGICGPPSGSGTLFDVDPLFCDEDAGNFELMPDSPCLPGVRDGRECDLVGAFPLGCGVSPTIETSWGRLKAQYR
jgi:hypothetical protein